MLCAKLAKKINSIILEYFFYSNTKILTFAHKFGATSEILLKTGERLNLITITRLTLMLRPISVFLYKKKGLNQLISPTSQI